MAYQEEYKSSFVMVLQNTLEEKQNTTILKFVQDLFDPSYIFLHPYIRQEINKSKNGYLRWKFIFSLTQFKEKLVLLGFVLKKCDEPLAGALFHYVVRKYSKKLRSNPGGVRIIGSFDIGDHKYLLARDYPCFEKLKQLMSVQTSISKIQEDIYNKYAVISTTDPELIVQKYDGYVWDSKKRDTTSGDEQDEDKLRVYSYSDYLRFRDYSKRTRGENRFNSLYSVRKAIAYPCYQEYKNKINQGVDEEICKKESEERLTDGMEEEP